MCGLPVRPRAGRRDARTLAFQERKADHAEIQHDVPHIQLGLSVRDAKIAGHGRDRRVRPRKHVDARLRRGLGRPGRPAHSLCAVSKIAEASASRASAGVIVASCSEAAVWDGNSVQANCSATE